MIDKFQADTKNYMENAVLRFMTSGNTGDATDAWPYYYVPHREAVYDYGIPSYRDAREEARRYSREVQRRENNKKFINPSNRKEGQPMETLFNVYVVTKDREVLLEERVVASDAEEAKFEANVASILKEQGVKPKDVTIICDEIAQVKVRKEIQKVKVVDKNEE